MYALGDPMTMTRMAMIGVMVPIITIPMLAVWSDSVGRRKILLVTLVSALLQTILLLFIHSFFVVGIIEILFGASACGVAAVSCYCADLTTSKNRAQVFLLIHAAWAFGFMLGSTLGSHYDLVTNWQVYLGIVVALSNALLFYFFVPESLKEENRSPFSLAKSHTIFAIAKLFNSRATAILTAVGFLAYLGVSAIGMIASNFMIYKNAAGPDYKMIAAAFAAGSSIAVLVSVIAALWIPAVGRSKVVVLSLAISAVGAMAYTFVPDQLFRIVVLLPVVATVAGAIIMASIVDRLAKDGYGVVIGGYTVFTLLIHIAGAQNNRLFSYLKEYKPGYLFLITLIPGLLFLSAILIYTNIPKEETTELS